MSKNYIDEYGSVIENVFITKEKIRHCKFCNKDKTTRYKIDEAEKHGGHTKHICDSCLRFISGMHNFGQVA